MLQREKEGELASLQDTVYRTLAGALSKGLESAGPSFTAPVPGMQGKGVAAYPNRASAYLPPQASPSIDRNITPEHAADTLQTFLQGQRENRASRLGILGNQDVDDDGNYIGFGMYDRNRTARNRRQGIGPDINIRRRQPLDARWAGAGYSGILPDLPVTVEPKRESLKDALTRMRKKYGIDDAIASRQVAQSNGKKTFAMRKSDGGIRLMTTGGKTTDGAGATKTALRGGKNIRDKVAAKRESSLAAMLAGELGLDLPEGGSIKAYNVGRRKAAKATAASARAEQQQLNNLLRSVPPNQRGAIASAVVAGRFSAQQLRDELAGKRAATKAEHDRNMSPQAIANALILGAQQSGVPMTGKQAADIAKQVRDSLLNRNKSTKDVETPPGNVRRDEGGITSSGGRPPSQQDKKRPFSSSGMF